MKFYKNNLLYTHPDLQNSTKTIYYILIRIYSTKTKFYKNNLLYTHPDL